MIRAKLQGPKTFEREWVRRTRWCASAVAVHEGSVSFRMDADSAFCGQGRRMNRSVSVTRRSGKNIGLLDGIVTGLVSRRDVRHVTDSCFRTKIAFFWLRIGEFVSDSRRHFAPLLRDANFDRAIKSRKLPVSVCKTEGVGGEIRIHPGGRAASVGSFAFDTKNALRAKLVWRALQSGETMVPVKKGSPAAPKPELSLGAKVPPEGGTLVCCPWL
jgi:hypothetical protein